MRLLLVDNYDSFVYNLAQAFGMLGAVPVVVRNDASIAQLEEVEPDAVVISPGPGAPDDAGVSVDAIRTFAGRVPVLGVCLGHQCIATAFGGRVARAEVGPLHGKTAWVQHIGEGVFAELPSPLAATRYHSLAVQEETLPESLQVTATSEDGVVMGLRHRDLRVEGVQVHPESILTEHGPKILRNFVRYAS